MITEEGGITKILSAMEKHSYNSYVQEYGCAALWSLAWHNDGGAEYWSRAWDNDDIMLTTSKKAIRRVCKVMENHLSNSNLQHYGCAALCNLAVNDINKVTIFDEGGIATILSAMRTHLSKVDVQHYGCAALFNLALNDINKLKITEERGIATILSALKTHSSNADLQPLGLDALEVLTS